MHQSTKSDYLSVVVYKHYGTMMGLTTYVLDCYGSQTFWDLYKLITIQKKVKHVDVLINKQQLQFTLMLGLKHQIIQHADNKYTFNEQAALGREYLPEFLTTQPHFLPIVQAAIQNGMFTVAQLAKNGSLQQSYDLVIRMIDEDFLIAYSESTTTTTTVVNNPTPSKKTKKNQKLAEKQQQQSQVPQQSSAVIGNDSLLQLNYYAIMHYLKQQALINHISKVYGIGIGSFMKEFLYQRKNAMVEIPLPQITKTLGLSLIQVQMSLQLLQISHVDGNKTVVPVMAYDKLQSVIRHSITNRWISDVYSPPHARVMQILRERKRAEEKTISDIALLDLTQARSILLEFLRDHMINTESQKGENNNKVIQIFIYDSKRLEERIRMQYYKSLCNMTVRDQLSEVYMGILNQMLCSI